MQNLDVNKTIGLDRIPAKLRKLWANDLEYPVSYLVNLPFTKRFSYCLKHSKVSAIFKTPSERKVENYRTIYLVSAVSKIFKGAMFNRRYAFLKNENVLSKNKVWFPTQTLYN